MKKFFKIFNIAMLVVLLGLIAYGATHTRQILDYFALRGYNPSSRVVELADKTTMGESTRNVFYVNHPKLQNKQEFRASCTQQEETIVLGCFIENKGIYLLEVDDPRLQGIVEVTAAHEVLHAVYERLSSSERAKVDKMTSDFFASLDTPRLKENIENYRKKDASIVPNELHSILASEVRNLSPELEEYYSKYFQDRSAIVALSEKYEQTFIDLENQVKAYDAQLKTLKADIDVKEQEIEQLGVEIDTERSNLDKLISERKIAQYNTGVEGFNVLVNRYNSLIKTRQSQALQYNQIVEEYNKLATAESELIKALKTDDLQPIGGVQ